MRSASADADIRLQTAFNNVIGSVRELLQKEREVRSTIATPSPEHQHITKHLNFIVVGDELAVAFKVEPFTTSSVMTCSPCSVTKSQSASHRRLRGLCN